MKLFFFFLFRPIRLNRVDDYCNGRVNGFVQQNLNYLMIVPFFLFIIINPFTLKNANIAKIDLKTTTISYVGTYMIQSVILYDNMFKLKTSRVWLLSFIVTDCTGGYNPRTPRGSEDNFFVRQKTKYIYTYIYSDIIFVE